MSPPAVRIFNQSEIQSGSGLTAAALACIENAFSALAEGRVIMPPPLGMHIDDLQGEVHVKTAYIRGTAGFAVKVATGFYGNSKLGLPNSSGLILYLDAQTGFVKAIFADNGYLTDLRTALAGAIAAKYLARTQIETVGIVGTGIQARWQLEALTLVRKFRQVIVFGRSADSADAYIREMKSKVDSTFSKAASVSALVKASDLVVTATTARESLIKVDDLHPGLHITAIGSDGPGKHELDPAVVEKADVIVCDSYEQCRRLGELQTATIDRNRVIELGEVTSGRKTARSSDHQLSVCDLTGTGVQDSAIADFTYQALAGSRKT
ncbi:MAG: ornithine cyclodeaminase family protein [Acidobacteria bacterium]|nr:ornithine cyclodeaminase family protein [Acidobacteriota bacterium]